MLGLTLPLPSQLPVASGLPWKTMAPLHKEVWNATLRPHALLLLHPLLTRRVIHMLADWRHFAFVNRVNTEPLPQKETQDRDCLTVPEEGGKEKEKTSNTQIP